MKWAARLILLSLLTSCSAQWHLKKAVQKDPMILEKDTMVVVDTVVLPSVGITDTVILEQHDTIELVKDRLKVKIVKVNDTVTIDAICDSDTIVRVVEVPYEKVVYVKEKTFFEKIEALALYAIVLFVVWLFIRKRLDKFFGLND